MRVPTYKAQTQRTQAVGGQMMSVQANPGALAAPAQAMQQLGETAFRVTAAFYEAEKKAERSAQVSRRTSGMTTAFQDVVLDAAEQKFETVEQAERYYDNAGRAIRLNAFEGVQDTRVTSSLQGNFETLFEANRINFLKTARTDIYDRNTADMMGEASQMINQAAGGNSTQRTEAMDRLFGTAQSLGIFAEMADLGYITEVEAQKRIATARSDIAETQVNAELAAAQVSGSSTQAEAVLLKLMNNEFADLDEDERNRLIVNAESLSTRLFNQQVTKTEKKERRDAAKVTKKQNTTFGQLFGQLVAGTSEDATDAQISSMPTEADIVREAGLGNLRPNQSKTLIELARGNDAPIDDAELVNDIYEILYEGSNEEINDAVDRAIAASGPNGKITSGTLRALLSTANSQRGQNDSAADKAALEAKNDRKALRNEYRGILKTLTGQDNMMSKFDDADRIRQADALKTFNELTTGGVGAKQAYEIVQDQFLRSLDQGLSFIAPSMVVRSAVGKPANEWLPEDLIVARRAVADSDLSEIEKAFEYETIQLISDAAIERKRAVDRATSDAAAKTAEENKGWGQFIMDLFGRGDDDQNKALQPKRGP
jgi:hypothetical protein